MKLTKILLLMAIAAMTSCTIVDLEDPLKGKITLVADWSKRTSGIEEPTSYSVIVNNQTLNYTQGTNLLPNFNVGTYPIYIYNTPDKISIAGTTATVGTANNNVDPLPGWLFTATTQATYADFKVETITVVMQQQVKQLTLTLKPTGGAIDRITDITASLSGIAGVWDFKTNQPQGSVMNAPLIFTKQSDGRWQATVRLLGIIANDQKLTGTITFTDGIPADIPLESNLTTDLAIFNTEKNKPLTLDGSVEVQTEAGLTATITDWNPINGGTGIAN